MSPLASLPALLAVLVLCRSPLAIASISEPTLSGAACGGDQVVVLDASDGVLNLSINGVLVQDRVLGCEKLLSYFGSGCLRCNQLPDVWRGAVKQYCSEGSESIHATSAQNVPRKFLKPQAARNKIDYGPCGKMSLHGNDQETNDSSGNGDHLLAVPGVILLCCGLMFPCFHAEKKEARRYNTATIQRNTATFGKGSMAAPPWHAGQAGHGLGAPACHLWAGLAHNTSACAENQHVLVLGSHSAMSGDHRCSRSPTKLDEDGEVFEDEVGEEVLETWKKIV
ncbi:hypothetical protein PR202_ga29913 [Eleusine coracana subsp. coracana]|uniref:Uncharacterized protein n=1 Tax=Eleusine coracana subsp. coracana TaxID=191504 RepID=A0AAV5DMD5_ELECO|nr:hypothetical protein PR202_ga29913 [Eleusine coracana subsp. coracana]